MQESPKKSKKSFYARIGVYAVFLFAAVYVYKKMRETMLQQSQRLAQANDVDAGVPIAQSPVTPQVSDPSLADPVTSASPPASNINDGVLVKGLHEYETLLKDEQWDAERNLTVVSTVKRTDFAYPKVLTQALFRKGVQGERVEAGERRMVADHFIVTLNDANERNSFVAEVAHRGWLVRNEMFDGKMIVVGFDLKSLSQRGQIFEDLKIMPQVKAVVADDLTSQP